MAAPYRRLPEEGAPTYADEDDPHNQLDFTDPRLSFLASSDHAPDSGPSLVRGRSKGSDQLLLIDPVSGGAGVALLRPGDHDINSGDDLPVEQVPDDFSEVPNLSYAVWKHELRQLLAISVPVMATFILEVLPGFTGLIFLGHLHGQKYIDAAALGNMFSNVTGLSVGFGLATGLDTLCAQAHGAKRTDLIGVYLQRALYITIIACIPIFFFSWYAGDILAALGQPKDVAELTTQYCRYLLIGLPFVFFYELLRKALQGQNILAPMLYIAIASNVINVVTCYCLIYVADLGYLGAAIARSITYVTLPAMLLGYVWWSGLSQQFWSGWSKEGFRGWIEYLKLAIPGMMALCLEWWAFEVVALMAGLLKDSHVALGAHTLVFSTSGMTFMMYLGTAVAASVRVGNCLGANMPLTARNAALTSLSLGAMMGLFWCGMLFALRAEIAKWETSDPEIQHEVKVVFIALAAYQVCDAVNGVASGVFRGAGRQRVAALTNFTAYYLIGLPGAYLLGFQADMGLRGMWWAMTAGLGSASTFSSIIVLMTNWQKQASEAQARVEEGIQQADEASAASLHLAYGDHDDHHDGSSGKQGYANVNSSAGAGRGNEVLYAGLMDNMNDDGVEYESRPNY